MPTETIRINGRAVKTLKWMLRPGLKAVFVGINPALKAPEKGHYYQGKLGKRLWKRLQDFGIASELAEGREDVVAFEQGFGFADLVRRPTTSAKELTNEEIQEGTQKLVQKLVSLPDRPLIAFVFAKGADKALPLLAAGGFETIRLPGPFAPRREVEKRMNDFKARLAERGDQLGTIMTKGVPKNQRTHVPRELLSSVVRYFSPVRVILFGSAARGESDTESDHDLLVLLDDDAPPVNLSWRACYEARRDYHQPVDIIPCRESVFRQRAQVSGSFAQRIATEGAVVYEREP